MAFETITPIQAAETLRGNGDAVYLDVRSQREFAAGHPAGAINIPIAEPDPRSGQLAPNPEFRTVVEKTLPKEKTILVGCMSGKRSEMACRILDEAGYTDLSNVSGGFGGARDPMGNVVQAGWADSHLPVSDDVGEGVSYESLRRRAFAS